MERAHALHVYVCVCVSVCVFDWVPFLSSTVCVTICHLIPMCVCVRVCVCVCVCVYVCVCVCVRVCACDAVGGGCRDGWPVSDVLSQSDSPTPAAAVGP